MSSKNLEISPCSEAKVTSRGRQREAIKPQTVQAIDEDEEGALFEAREFYNSDPASCTSKSWDEIRKLRWGDFQLQPQNDGQIVLVWLAELGTKTLHGQERKHQRTFQLSKDLCHQYTARCSVSFYKKFHSHQPVEMNASESPFYLAAVSGIINAQMKKFGM